ncbi:hypothetical protein Tco_0520744 [Tanacetum coccineum]
MTREEVNYEQYESIQMAYRVAQRLICLKYSSQDEDSIRQALRHLKEWYGNDGTHKNDWECPKCGNVNFIFRWQISQELQYVLHVHIFLINYESHASLKKQVRLLPLPSPSVRSFFCFRKTLKLSVASVALYFSEHDTFRKLLF